MPSMADSGSSIACEWIVEGRRFGVFAQRSFCNGTEIERCYARLVPTWQADRSFIWFYGAFRGSAIRTSSCEGGTRGGLSDQSSLLEASCGEAGVIIPFGWGMLYADSTRNQLVANVSCSVEMLSSEDDIAEDADPSFGRPCWLVLRAASCNCAGIAAGEELVVDRGYETWEGAVDQADILTVAVKRLGGCDLSRVSPEEGRSFVPKDDSPNNLSHPLDAGVQLQYSSRHGLGVFSARAFEKGEVVEIAPVVVVRDEEAHSYASGQGLCHSLSNYTFDAGLSTERLVCVTLGFGAIYNHGSCPNIEQHWAYSEAPSRHASNAEHGYALSFAFAFVAKRDISKGEELLHNYGSTYWDARGVFPED